MANHSPEPWILSQGTHSLEVMDRDDNVVFYLQSDFITDPDRMNFLRAVLCVNACVDLSNEDLFHRNTPASKPDQDWLFRTVKRFRTLYSLDTEEDIMNLVNYILKHWVLNALAEEAYNQGDS